MGPLTVLRPKCMFHLELVVQSENYDNRREEGQTKIPQGQNKS